MNLVLRQISKLQREKKITHKEFGEIINISEQGILYKYRKDSFKIEDIYLLARHFNIPITYFFEDTISGVEEPVTKYGCKECLKKDGQIELLKEQLEEKDIEIKELRARIDMDFRGTGKSKTKDNLEQTA